ncbi:toprim domain-containing protein [Marinobacter sp. F4206]|uniref:toprim domain-containing protein n=1 Tax=Marinobacter sp. F4206 TaxID=2861777 RepID=UPI001C6057E1|nr:toprim domain-containing protein [Marinobacter sp. F4206]MBW4934460.1 toprim domain-containing protein [Marinobacter sp. F4206]
MIKAPAPEGARHQTRNQCSVTTSCADRLEAIRIALLENGIEPANPDDFLSQLANHEGRFIRTGSASKPRSKNAWGVAYHSRGLPIIVIAGDWSTGAEMKWVAWNESSITPEERRELQRSMADAKQAREEEQARQWEAKAAAAARHWHSSHSADPEHPYLQSKGIQPHKARQNGCELVLLLTDFNGKAWSLQTINEAGNKRLMAGGKKAGHFVVVDGPEYPARILICEGYATGCTLAELDRDALVLAAVDCGNLKAVATGARNRWPDADLIVCGDDDRATPGNPGATAARAAALAAGARLALPEWPPEAPKHLSDFNDLHEWLRGQL